MRLSRGGPAVLVLAGLVLTGCGAGSSASAPSATHTATTGSSEPGAPPTVTESFTLLPCPGPSPTTTLQLEGCAEHRIVKLDRQINLQFRALYDKAAGIERDRLHAAQASWISYRRAECLSEFAVYSGGTLAPVAFANCEVRINRARLADLAAMRTP